MGAFFALLCRIPNLDRNANHLALPARRGDALHHRMGAPFGAPLSQVAGLVSKGQG